MLPSVCPSPVVRGSPWKSAGHMVLTVVIGSFSWLCTHPIRMAVADITYRLKMQRDIISQVGRGQGGKENGEGENGKYFYPIFCICNLIFSFTFSSHIFHIIHIFHIVHILHIFDIFHIVDIFQGYFPRWITHSVCLEWMSLAPGRTHSNCKDLQMVNIEDKILTAQKISIDIVKPKLYYDSIEELTSSYYWITMLSILVKQKLLLCPRNHWNKQIQDFGNTNL